MPCPGAICNCAFPGGDLADAFGIHEVRVTTAVDDTGHDLRLDSEQERTRRRFSQGNMYAFQGNGFAMQTTHMVELVSPARNAHTINSSKAKRICCFLRQKMAVWSSVKDFLAHPGETISDPLLKKWNVNITYLGKDTPETNATQAAPSAADRLR